MSEEAREDGLPAAPLDLSGALRASVGDLFHLPRLNRRGIVALTGLVLLAWLTTSLYRVQPDEKGVVLRFGQWVATTEPGLHVHLPYPIETVLLPKVTQINQMQLGVGSTAALNDAQSGRARQMLTGDENIVEADGAVFWKIRDPGQFLFRVDNPELAVRIAAEGALRDVISRTPIQAAMSNKRQQIADETQALLQRLLDDDQAGVEITQVQLQRVEPPLAVIDAFNDVQRARADQERARNEAEAYANDILPRARGDAERIRQEAEAYKVQVVNLAQGDADAFVPLLRSYEAARDVTARRLYMDSVDELLKKSSKVIVDASGRGVSSIVPYLPMSEMTPLAPAPATPAAGSGEVKSRALLIALGFAALALTVAASSIYVINEGEQGLVVRLGAPVGVVDQPGLKLKAPFIDSVYVTSTRSLLLEPPLEQVIMGDEKRLEVQPYARYRIVDPLRFYQALRTSETANAQLAQLVSSSARRELGQVPLRALLTEERGHILDVIKGEVAAKAEPLGVKVDEVRFDRSDLPFETSQAIYDRMKSERQREAKELRAQGFEWAQQIEARADHDRTVILSEAHRDAAIARGDGDAKANQALAAAFSQDPQFYSFYRSLQTYRNALANSAPTMVVSPDADFIQILKSGPKLDAASAPVAEGAKP